jgi:hypothetical protein
VFARTLVVAVAGLCGAAIAGAAIAGIGEVFILPPELAALGVGGIPGAADQQRIAAGNAVVFYKHSALWVATAGAILGGLFGLVLGLFRRSATALVVGTLAGTLLGGAFGACAGPLAVYLDRFLRANLPSGQLAVSDSGLMLMHAAPWLVVGLGCGLGAGLGAFGKRGRTAAGTMLVAGVAGLLGGAVYPIVAGMVLPLADPSLPIPEESGSRLLWLGLPAVLMGLSLGRKG